MQDMFLRLADAPMARMFVLAGIIFLMFAVIGKVEGKIDPGNIGRIGAAILGVALMIIGVTMQYAEMHDLRQEQIALLQRSASAIMPNASVSTTQIAPSENKLTILVVNATYGRSCNGKSGNASTALSKACDGKSTCDYEVEAVDIENATANCARDFAAEWKCGNGSVVYSAVLPGEAVSKHEKLHLACMG